MSMVQALGVTGSSEAGVRGHHDDTMHDCTPMSGRVHQINSRVSVCACMQALGVTVSSKEGVRGHHDDTMHDCTPPNQGCVPLIEPCCMRMQACTR